MYLTKKSRAAPRKKKKKKRKKKRKKTYSKKIKNKNKKQFHELDRWTNGLVTDQFWFLGFQAHPPRLEMNEWSFWDAFKGWLPGQFCTVWTPCIWDKKLFSLGVVRLGCTCMWWALLHWPPSSFPNQLKIRFANYTHKVDKS